jgi:cell division protein FtsI (penicillin-binding protein 3)
MSGGALRRSRLIAVGGVFALFLALLLARAVDLTVVRGPEFARRAQRQHTKRMALVPHRGEIVDRNGDMLALSLNVPSIYMRPRELGAEGRARLPEVAKALGLSPAWVQEQVDKGQPFVWLKRQALPRELEAVQALGVPGIGHFEEARRVYPHGSLAAHVLGFVGTDAQGLGGLERRFDRDIRGEVQTIDVARDAHGRAFLRTDGGAQAGPPRGSRVELTIDATIQAAVERELALGVANAKAAAGIAVVLDPWTGEVMALANVPTFNPNDRSEWGDRRHKDKLRNRAVTDPFEPGSTFKAFLAAAALDLGITTPSERFFAENGAFTVGKWTINDAHPHGWLSFAEVIQVSSNIGCAKVGLRMGSERYYEYLRRFGFGEPTGIELPSESGGIMRPLSKWTRIDLTVQSFGQGVSVTPLQMAAAYAAIANGGTLMRPHLVRRIVAPDGRVTYENGPRPVRRVLGEAAARTTTELLRRVVEEKGGTGGRARLEDFSVAGKTGTAQKVSPGSRGYSSKRIGSFVGFVPADHPRAVIVVSIDEPTTATYGGVVAAPVFKAIALHTLKALGVNAPAKPEPEPAPEPTLRQARAKGVVPVRAEVASVPAAPEVADSGEPRTPSFLGLSLREALTRAHADGWAVEIRGSGWVAGQQPPPGAPLAEDRRLALELSPDRPLAQP